MDWYALYNIHLGYIFNFLISRFYISKRSFVMDFDTLKYQFNATIVKSTLNLIDFKNRKAINGSVMFLEDVQQFNVAFYGKVSTPKGKLRTLFNMTLNGCEFIENKWKKANLIANIAVREVKKHFKQLPSKCPIKKVCFLESYKKDFFYLYFFNLRVRMF